MPKAQKILIVSANSFNADEIEEKVRERLKAETEFRHVVSAVTTTSRTTPSSVGGQTLERYHYVTTIVLEKE